MILLKIIDSYYSSHLFTCIIDRVTKTKKSIAKIKTSAFLSVEVVNFLVSRPHENSI